MSARSKPHALVLAGMLAYAAPCAASGKVRPFFEPTDLELEVPGTVEVDTQFGLVRSQGPFRLVMPDFEVDLGILNNLELDVDGAYAIEGPAQGPFRLDHAAPDSLWTSLKVGLLDVRGARDDWAIAFGTQLGPKLPVATGTHGLGVEGLLLLGLNLPPRGTHLALNLGAFRDPRVDPVIQHPLGIEAGLDIDQDLDSEGTFSLTGELSGVHFLSDDPAELMVTAGGAYAPREWLELSLTGMLGFLSGNDRYGVLLGVSPKFAAWK